MPCAQGIEEWWTEECAQGIEEWWTEEGELRGGAERASAAQLCARGTHAPHSSRPRRARGERAVEGGEGSHEERGGQRRGCEEGEL